MRPSTRWLLLASTLALTSACRKTPADHLARAAQYASHEQYQEAIIEYRAALQQNGQLGEARLKLADVYAKVGDPVNAAREYIRAADLLPNNVDAQLKGGAMLLMANRFADAKARAEAALRVAPRNAGALLLLGNALAGVNDMGEAFERLNEAIEADPSSGAAYSNLAVLQLTRGDQQRAEASFKKAINLSPKSAVARLALAQFYRSQNRTQDEEVTLKDARQVDPRNVSVNSSLAELYIRTGRARDAETPLKTVADVLQNAASQFALAEYYVRTNRSAEAVPLLVKLAASPDNNALAKARLAAIDYSQGRAADAYHTLDEVLRREPRNRAALLLKGQLLSTEKKFDAALPLLTAAAAADPPRAAQPLLVTAKIYQAVGRVEEAEDAYKQVLALEPRSVGAQLGLSQLYVMRGNARTAIEFAHGAVESDPANANTHLALVRALVAAGNAAETQKELQLLESRFPASAEVNVQLGDLFLLRNDRGAAKAAFTKALSIDSRSVEALAALVGLDLAQKDSVAAVSRLDTRLRETPDDAQVWFLAAQTYLQIHNLTRTEEALRKTIQYDPSNLRAFALLGAVYGGQGRNAEALTEFQAWTAREPRSVAAHTMLALLLERQGKPAEAQKAYEHVLELDPHAAVAANNLAWLYSESDGNLDVALQLAEEAVVERPDEPEFKDTEGWILYKKDLFTQALPLIQQAAQQDPNNASFQFHLGMIYARQSMNALAVASLKRALALDPHMAEAAEAQRVIQDMEDR